MKNKKPTEITGIFGYPVKHTLSPSMHNAAFKSLKLDFVYLPFEVKPEVLGAAVEALKLLNIKGVNVTIPHKSAVIEFLDQVDPLAKKIGSVNTIINNNGVLKGYNTDATGFIQDLKDLGFHPKNKSVLLIGAGGAGRAVASALSWAGAKKILITDTDEKKSKGLSQAVTRSKHIPFSNFKQYIAECGLLINATPNGMHPGDKPLLSPEELNKNIFIYDLVYNRETELMKAAKVSGARHSGGLGMLLNQGALAFKIWTGKKAPTGIMRKALVNALLER